MKTVQIDIPAALLAQFEAQAEQCSMTPAQLMVARLALDNKPDDLADLMDTWIALGNGGYSNQVGQCVAAAQPKPMDRPGRRRLLEGYSVRLVGRR